MDTKFNITQIKSQPKIKTNMDLDNLIPEVDQDEVRLIIGKTNFVCSRTILAKHSQYFAAMFTCDMKEKNSEFVALHDICPGAMKHLMTYCATEKFQANWANVDTVLEAAAMLQFTAISTCCIDFLSSELNVNNCLGIMCIADKFSISDLYFRARQISMWNASQILQGNEILDQSASFLNSYLSSDGLKIKNEIEVFEAICSWVAKDEKERKTFWFDLLKCIRYQCFTGHDRKHLLRVKKAVAAVDDYRCASVINEVTDVLKGRRGLVVKRNSRDSLDSVDSSIPLNTSQSGAFSKGNSSSCSGRMTTSIKKGLKRLKRTSSVANTDQSRSLQSNANENGHLLKSLAVSLCEVSPRKVPMFPAVVGSVFNRDESNLAYFNPNTGSVVSIGQIDKISRKGHVAMGYRSCLVGKDVYFLGGEYLLGYGNWNSSVWSMDIFTGKWVSEGCMPQPRRHHSVCALDGNIYVIGGIGKHRVQLSTVEKFDTQTREWKNCASLPYPLFSAACTAYKNHIYVLESKVHRYDPQTDSWITIRRTDLPNICGFHSALPHAPTGSIYLLGRNNSTLIAFHVDEEQYGTNMPLGSFRHSTDNACIIDDVIYSFGSEEEFTLESYDIVSNEFRVESRVASGLGVKCSHGCFPLPVYQ